MIIIYTVLMDVEEEFGQHHQELDCLFSTIETAVGYVKDQECPELHFIYAITLDHPEITWQPVHPL